MKFKTKQEILDLYVDRYDKLDGYAKEFLGEKYDDYIRILKDVKTEEEYYEVFKKLEADNEDRFKSGVGVCVDSSPHNIFMEVLSSYGIIVFFRDNLI